MSETHIVVGLAARLKNQMSKDTISEFNDAHNDEIFVNYEGTIAYVETINVPSYEFRMLLGSPMDAEEFLCICAQHGLEIDNSVILPFFVSWHDSCDSPLSTMKSSDFVKAKR